MWGIDEIKDYLKGNLKPSRYGHTLGVVNTAIKLAEVYDEDKFKAEIAALCHDVAKNMTPFRTVLDYLTEKTLENYITNDTDREIDLIISKEDIMILLKEALIINGFDTKLLDKEGSNICKITKPILFSHD